MIKIFETESRYAKELSDEDLASVNAAGVPDMAYCASKRIELIEMYWRVRI